MALLLFCIISSQLYAQQVSADFGKVANKLRTSPVSFQTHYTMYSRHEGGILVQNMTAYYSLWQDQFYYRMEDVELISNKRFSLSVDHGQKTMVLNKSNPEFDKKLHREMLKFNTDSLLSHYATAKLISQSGSERTWRIVYQQPINGISYLDLTLDAQEYLIRKIVLYYAKTFNQLYERAPRNVQKTDKPRLEITYTGYKTLTDVEKERVFSASQILTVDNKGKTVLADSYKGYRIANYYNMKK